MNSTLLPLLVSLLAAGHAVLATGISSLPTVTIALAAATLFGAEGEGGVDPSARSHRSVQAWIIYIVVLTFAVALLATRGQHEVLIATRMLLGMQVLCLGLRAAAHATMPVFVNAQVLACLAAMAGGLLAATALVGTAVLCVTWLGLRHQERHRVPMQRALRAVAPYSAFTAGFLGLGLYLAPAPRVATTVYREAARQLDRPLEEAYLDLAAWTVAGVIALLVARWLLLRRQENEEKEEDQELDGIIDLEELEAIAPGRAPMAVDPTSPRARVIARYLEFLREAAGLGHARAASITPREHARGLGDEAAAPAGRLTDLFGRARYGAAEPVEVDVEETERAARETSAALRSR